MFNFWRPYPFFKPKKPGDYLCSVKYPETHSHIVEKLHYSDGEWINKSRQSVFDGYNVYKLGRATLEENHVYNDILSELPVESIVAWKKLPKPYRRKVNRDDS